MEYQETNGFHRGNKNSINLTRYTKDDLREMITFLGEVFDLVRLVDPRQTAVVTINKNGSTERMPYSCFNVWKKHTRCKNCSSMCALNAHCTMTKFELLKNDVFYVVSQPITVMLENESEDIVLEIASKVTDENDAYVEVSETGFRFLEDIQMKIYTDPLTKAFNRRFLDEMIFLHFGQNKVIKQLALVLFDIRRFKQINDLYGHQVGDKVLQEVAQVLKNQLRNTDSLIRYGGDEFIIILAQCQQEQINESLERFGAALSTIKYGTNKQLSLKADFGVAFTRNFVPNEAMLTKMVKEADDKMYHHKRMAYQREDY